MKYLTILRSIHTIRDVNVTSNMSSVHIETSTFRNVTEVLPTRFAHSSEFLPCNFVMPKIAIILDEEDENRNRRRRTCWIRDVLRKRKQSGKYCTLFDDLKEEETLLPFEQIRTLT